MTDCLFHTRANGKLLLTGEYAVLDGALALAVPVRYGQTLAVQAANTSEAGILTWNSVDEHGKTWFSAQFNLPDCTVINTSDTDVADTLARILLACRRQNPDFLRTATPLEVVTQNDFPRAWGLGTSSTLIAAVAQWAQVNPWQVLSETLGGSGYDLACAYAQGPLWYRLEAGKPIVESVHFAPSFSEQLWLVYLGKKQNSREGIRQYQAKKQHFPALPQQIEVLTKAFTAAANLKDLEAVIREHETLISEALQLPRAQDLYFGDYWGETKSLGAWGGDFVLATSHRSAPETQAYFQQKGFDTVIPYGEMTRKIYIGTAKIGTSV